jgi:N-acetylglucosaminyl-diphospho-decaprenol L-rhamnosyltransferase
VEITKQSSEPDRRPQTPVTRSICDVSVIIVNWKSAAYVQSCVESIHQHTSGIGYEVIVVDNASFDGCDKMLQEHAPGVKYIQLEVNLGFAKANNHAFRASRGTNILFLNPDTILPGNAIGILHRELSRHPSVGAVGATLLNADGTLQTSCVQAFPSILNQALDSEYFRKKWPASGLWGVQAFLRANGQAEEVEAISGACLMIKRDVFDSIGGFTEDYFMYGEDMDLCYKIRKAGFKNYYVPEARLIHFGGSSSKQVPSNFSIVMMRESIWRFLRNTRGDAYAIGYRFSMLASALCRLALLSVSMMIQLARGRRKLSYGSLRKWWAILGWSLSRGTFERSGLKGHSRQSCVA